MASEAKLGMSLDAIIEQNRKQFVTKAKKPAAAASAPKKGVRVGGTKRITVAPKARPAPARRELAPPQPAPRGRRQGGGGPRLMEMDVEPAPRAQRLGVARGGIRKQAAPPPRPAPRGGGAAAAYGDLRPMRGRGRGPAPMGRVPGGRGGRAAYDEDEGHDPNYRPRDPDAPGKWKHDLFQPNQGPARRLAAMPSTSRAAVDKTRLVVTNLAYSVSEDDVKELFGAIGNLRSAQIVWGEDNRSTGVAEIVYEDERSAAQAVEEYDKVQLDGQPMSVKFHSGAGAAGGGVFQRLGGRGGNTGGGGTRSSAGDGPSRMFQAGIASTLKHTGMGGGLSGGGAAPVRGSSAPRGRGVGMRLRSNVVRSMGDEMQE